MIIQKIVCDKCGAVIHDSVDGKTTIIGKLVYGGNEIDVDLCDDCIQAVFHFAKAVAEIPKLSKTGKPIKGSVDLSWKVPRTKTETPVLEDEKKFPAKKDLDDGKIYALRCAGWTYAKIAKELGFEGSQQTLVNHFNAYKAKHEEEAKKEWSLTKEGSADPFNNDDFKADEYAATHGGYEDDEA